MDEHLFTSAKTTMPIAIRSRLAAQALVQATLGHSVFEISPGFALDAGGCLTVGIDAVLKCVDGRRALIVAPAALTDDDRRTMVRTLTAHGLELLALDQGDVFREPFATNARMVWAYDRTPYSASDQIRVLHHLTECGPSPIIDLASSTSSNGGLAAVLAMCCRGVIDLDLLNDRLGPYTSASCPCWRNG